MEIPSTDGRPETIKLELLAACMRRAAQRLNADEWDRIWAAPQNLSVHDVGGAFLPPSCEPGWLTKAYTPGDTVRGRTVTPNPLSLIEHPKRGCVGRIHVARRRRIFGAEGNPEERIPIFQNSLDVKVSRQEYGRSLRVGPESHLYRDRSTEPLVLEGVDVRSEQPEAEDISSKTAALVETVDRRRITPAGALARWMLGIGVGGSRSGVLG
ncbi:hypothetical protein B0H16DRAFT_1485394 [Mycena metata]|uniref:Uncharacterized protein n=1 Tax=Mycena metata TaxID=1033252 RepID=A0AAD7DN55_9AGAR|nr:hypothetical protein B0H16DRAFT_1485394 [Mycena metata]